MGLPNFIALALFILVVCVGYYHTHKPLPAGISYESQAYPLQTVEFLYDLTYKHEGTVKHDQMIFKEILKSIRLAKEFIVIDLFLYNGYYDKDQSYPPLSRSLTNTLLAQKSKYPQLKIIVISDEINTDYGSHPAPEFQRLKAAGIPVILTDVDPLRDSTPAYSGLWRTFIQWFGQAGNGWIPNLMADQAPDLTARSYMKLLNVKANHRKVIVTENTAIIPTANAHDASSWHSNTAIKMSGPIISDILLSEQAAAALSSDIKLPEHNPQEKTSERPGPYQTRLLTEGKIYKYVLTSIREADRDDSIRMAMFYLADPNVLDALVQAANRGVKVQLILDPNENAFGRDKIGLPNRPVAEELHKKTDGKIDIRWYNTSEEQFHTKMMIVQGPKQTTLHNGSANFTTRNLDDLNLETNVMITASNESPLMNDVTKYFDKLWMNKGAEYTLDRSAYRDDMLPLQRFLYHVQTWLGFTTF
ncbi:phospholipase [Paenibacillus swuensis]|uniref:phospholipase D n=1 Tax=Paenibacillus swuensis TaxID=1178515 RepID=A0A172TQ62_9BACL|nr:phospholipase [Paenibacillus swuensis]